MIDLTNPDNRYPWEDADGNEHGTGGLWSGNPDLCRGCGGMILPEDRRIADGCICNSPRGVNHGLVPKNTCTCVECDPAQTGSTRYPVPAATPPDDDRAVKAAWERYRATMGWNDGYLRERAAFLAGRASRASGLTPSHTLTAEDVYVATDSNPAGWHLVTPQQRAPYERAAERLNAVVSGVEPNPSAPKGEQKKSAMSHDEIIGKLNAAYLYAAQALLHELSNSLASFIAAIDANSCDVSAYLEQRLAPLIPLMRTDERVRAAIERIGKDGRQLIRSKPEALPEPEPPQPSDAETCYYCDKGVPFLNDDGCIHIATQVLGITPCQKRSALFRTIRGGIEQGFHPSDGAKNYAIIYALEALSELERRRGKL